MRKNPTTTRQGSIPVVVGLSVVLATLGFAALFMTNGMNRLDRRADLARKASWIASTAAEETILGLMNGSADWMTPFSGQKNVKMTYPAPATAMMYGQTGALIDPVKVMGRRLDGPPLDSGWRNKVYGALSAGPHWAFNHDPDWEARLTAQNNKLRTLIHLPPGVTPDETVKALYAAKYGGTAKESDEIAKAYHDGFENTSIGHAEGVRDALDKTGEGLAKSAAAASCGNLAPDVGVLTAIGSLAFAKDAVEDKSVGQIGSFEELQAAPAEADAPNGAPAPVASASPAASADADGKKTEGKAREKKPFSVTDFRQLSERGGVLRKDRYLVTLEAAARMEGADMEIEVPHITHRIFARLHYGDAMMYTYGRMLAYVGYHYQIPYEAFVKFGMVSKQGELNPDKIMPALEQAYTAHPGPQAWPFPVATSIMRVAE